MLNIKFSIPKFLTKALVLICFIFLPVRQSPAESPSGSLRQFVFYNTHTYERLTVTYKNGENYISQALKKIDYILRDHRSGEIHAIDPNLLDYLYDLLTEVGNHGEVHIISGYRSPKTNKKMRKNSKGVAAGSLHMKGKALDFRLPGTATRVLRDTALKLKRGGVGYYKKSDFIQIDTGRFRFWKLPS